MTEKGLDYYLQNPDELPSDPSEIEALMSKQGEAKTEKQAEVATEEIATKEEPPAPETKEEAEPDVVLTKDGKRAIPYKVLASERDRARAAEQAVADLKKQLESLQTQASTGETTEQAEAGLSEEDLAAIGEDFPHLRKILDGLTGHIKKLEGTVTELRDRESSREAVEQKQTASTVQEAIEATPALLYWQNENSEMFDEAIKYDDMIRANPKNQSLTLEERFQKVVAAMEAVYGPTELPKEYQKEVAAPSKDEAAALAKKAIENAEVRRPRTLSDMPGGIPPAQSERERVENMSPSALAAMMSKMSPDDLSAFLAKTV